jgi:hypothetical protein
VAIQLTFEGAHKRTFFRVDPQVVVEVVPLTEVHWTAWIITLQNFEETLCFWIFKLEDSKGPSAWDVVLGLLHVYLNAIHIFRDVRPMNHFDNCAVWRYLLLHTFVVNGVSVQFNSHHFVIFRIRSENFRDVAIIK